MTHDLAGAPGSAGLDSEINLIDRLIAEQQRLTAVERFAQKHERQEIPLQAAYYSELIPLSKPSAGQQYAFEVDLDRCTGCKACVSACHSLNGLEENETWRDVGLIVGYSKGKAYQQTVTTACHHCAEPGCLEGCPVMAYDKDSETGIVRHLDDQCIGCQYCTMKCPYDVPKYSHSKGIVRKCDMCHDRLAVGEAPACVQACPHEAIRIRIIDKEEISAQSAPGNRMLPGAYDSSYTKPSTRYLSKRVIPKNAESASAHALHLEHPHWPLIIMLVLSQMAVGAYAWLAFAGAAGIAGFARFQFPLAAFGFAALNAGLLAAVFHLGRPLGAWRFFLGLRTSWMSREILAFSVAATAFFPVTVAAWFLRGSPLMTVSAGVAAFFGLVAVFTSVMIYADTHRAFWSVRLVVPRFFGATFLLGAAVCAALSAWTQAVGAAHLFAIATLATMGVLYCWELSRFENDLSDSNAANHKPALLINQLLPWYVPARAFLLILSFGLLFAALMGSPGALVAGTTAALATAFAAQILERFVFFTAVIPLRMPGGV